MSVSSEQQANLHARLWDIANDLRGNMEANEFKNYILELIFYRYLSEKVEGRAEDLLKEDNISYREAWEDEEYREALQEELLAQIGYFIEPKYLFSSLMKEIETGNFDVEMLQGAINDITESTLGHKSEDDFDHLFDDMDLTSTKLGRDVKSRSNLIAKVMGNISQIDFKHDDAEIDVLGDAYEYLISQFAATAGKKAGEFYTPQQVSKILAKLVTVGKKDLKSVYDPACGSGSLLLRVSKEANVRYFYGQELTSTTYNLARMNMLLHDISYERFDIRNDDTLENPEHIDMKFDAVVANPPYSAKWSADNKFLDDERFSAYGKLAPKSKADYAFVQHMIYQLNDGGTMAVVLPHGVLFRGAAEGVIRKYLIKEKNYLDGIIGLPPNIFFGTSIPTAILVFKKCRENSDNVIFIDASREFEKGKNQNVLRDCDVEKIISTYVKREAVDKYAYKATLDEIKENDYNLNIPRYVDTFEEEEPVDIKEVKSKIEKVDKEIEEIDKELEVYLKELGI
ncbi:type I restriction-modification system subunit M [Clostridium botulinum]|uniref:site-specific DNA-methyltransferase (adenine-specific) n=1 Tax=Clostridium botulinum TaxID=1491 RepID=A0A846J5L4_CLOBO|nr:type I restriction-modification system subunit M [Clostridium botulinum]ACA57194.1 type I restriction-modification system, M subunit [Clostridium botulinum A3 str. Loch Maree]NFH64706.1 type I restriction-modification system subunit M [Clostridium botulinum]NFJ08520.1 type I restriction-modification system subunit M [Clostridium botulinum]NFK14916.1 type I restriction-modification system subunit M [Clostridium botulinum]NFM95250.1 type I restriction-modification system subunit M [Clostridiu